MTRRDGVVERRDKQRRPVNQGTLVRGGLRSNRQNADHAAVLAAIGKLDHAIDAGEERIVFGAADVFAGLIASATLANQNAAAGDQLAAKALYAEPLPVGVAPVCR